MGGLSGEVGLTAALIVEGELGTVVGTNLLLLLFLVPLSNLVERLTFNESADLRTTSSDCSESEGITLCITIALMLCSVAQHATSTKSSHDSFNFFFFPTEL